jgi:hypothetical protein
MRALRKDERSSEATIIDDSEQIIIERTKAYRKASIEVEEKTLNTAHIHSYYITFHHARKRPSNHHDGPDEARLHSSRHWRQ